MNRTKSFALGVLAGGIAAGISTCLSAPYSGKTTRAYLKDKNQAVKDTILEFKERTGEVKENIHETFTTSNAIVKNVVKDIAKSASKWKENTQPHQLAMQAHLHEVQETLTDLEQQVQQTKNH